MADLTLLQIIQGAAVSVGVPKPAGVTSVGDPQVQQLLEFAQQEGEDLIANYDWTALISERDFIVIAGNEQPDALPDDYMRLTREGQIWNVDRQLPIIGPVSSDEWTHLTTRVAQTEPQYWRIFGQEIHLFTPVAGETLRFEYVNKNWITQAGGAGPGNVWNNDADTSLLPSRLLKQGAVWRFKQAKGLDYAEDMETYERWKEVDTGSDGSPKSFRMSRKMRNSLPQNFWPGQIVG